MKQFAVWVTELRNDLFVRARIKLTFLYAASIVFVFSIFYLILNQLRINELRHRLDTAILNPTAREEIINQLAQSLDKTTLVVFGFIAIIVIVINYFIAGKTLSPIRQIVRTQKRFIADASHELRTPLAIMKTNSEVALLDGRQMSGSDAFEVLHSNLEEIDRMSKIIENLLSLSYYDSRVTEIPFMPVSLADVVRNITNKAQSLAIKKAVKLTLAQADEGMILGNITAIEQMTMNLIKNAVTYTPQGGEVRVSVENRNRSLLELKVEDSGIGISPEDLPHIFSPFYKAGDGRHQEEGTSGLGLTIVKKIVDRHQGEIRVESEINKGTLFCVSFPGIMTLKLRKTV